MKKIYNYILNENEKSSAFMIGGTFLKNYFDCRALNWCLTSLP